MIYPLSDPQPYLTNSSFAIKDANSDFLPGTIDPKDLVISALCSGLPEVYACLLDAGLGINHRLPGYTGSALVTASKLRQRPPNQLPTLEGRRSERQRELGRSSLLAQSCSCGWVG